MLLIASPRTVHLVGQNPLIPEVTTSEGSSALMLLNAALRLGENRIS